VEDDPGRDDYFGGPGFDTVDFRYSTVNLTVRLDGLANDGEAAERDNVRGDVEAVIGGTGDDLLVGNDADNTLIGGDGDDRIIGNGGNDTLLGGAGLDKLSGGDGRDLLDGRDNGYAMPDLLDGGSGFDRAHKDDADAVLHIESFL
jgi:Ca2+-binding RTX toxin-like protein